MKKSFKILLLLLLLLILGSVAYFYANPKKALLIIFPDVKEIQKVHIKLLRDSALIDIALQVQNSSFLKLNIDSLIYHIRLDTNTVLKDARALQIILKPSQRDMMNLPLALSFKGIRKQIRSLQGTDSMSINIDLRVVYSTIFGRTNLPVTRELRLEVPRPPEVEFLKTEFDHREKNILFVNAHIKIRNYGNGDITLEKINYKMKVKDLFVVEDAYPGKIHVKPRSNHTFILPVKIEVKRVLKTAFLVLTDNDIVPYNLRVTAFLSSDSLDNERVPLEIEKDGQLELRK